MKRKGLMVLIAASEAAPLAKTGGLGDVVEGLSCALGDLGCEVAVALPGYEKIIESCNNITLRAGNLPVSLGKRHLDADILEGRLASGAKLYLVSQDAFFARPGIYGDRHGEYPDNPERFIFFSRAIPLLCEAAGIQPDIILANDWHTGLVMPLINEGLVPGCTGVFTIHNMGYLGLVPPDRIENIGLPDTYYGLDGLEFFGQMSLLKAGIVYAQAITTVSPTYAREIQTTEFGAGLDGLMRSVKNRLHGILNGVDYRTWNPATDRYVVTGYSPRDLSGKATCKKELLDIMGLSTEFIQRPLIGMVTRLVEQKGCSLVIQAADRLFDLGVNLVLLGSGDAHLEAGFSGLKDRYPDRFGLRLTFDEVLAHKIIAGSDMLLMPSLYEPCGLTQIYSLKYGTIPVVRGTGGLNDTVNDPDDGHWDRTGFKFYGLKITELVRAVERAVHAFHNKKIWTAMVTKAMQQDFSWHRSAQEYLALFENTMATGKENLK